MWRGVRGFSLVCTLIFCCLAIVRANAQSAGPDPETGIKLEIPSNLGLTSRTTRNGREWRTSDARGRISIEALRFDHLTLRRLYDSLRNIKGRVLRKDEWNGDSFILEGVFDSGRQNFYVEAHDRGGKIRGLSIDYPKSR